MSYKKRNKGKSFFALIIIAIMLFCYSTAFAVTYDEWIHTCPWKTARSTNVYGDLYCETAPIYVLPANTYVKINTYIGDFYNEIYGVIAMLRKG